MTARDESVGVGREVVVESVVVEATSESGGDSEGETGPAEHALRDALERIAGG